MMYNSREKHSANGLDMTHLLEAIRADLLKNSDAKTKESFRRFFKHDIQCYGVKGPFVRKIAGKYFKEVKTLDKGEVFSLCENLFRSKLCEEAFIAAAWLDWISDSFVPKDIAVFEQWIDRYIDDWAKCDTLCNHAMGPFLERFPSILSSLKQWALSHNLFLRRSAAVTLILPARKGLFLDEVFEISDILLLDQEDLVQKGYGWMLKEASRKAAQKVFSYLMRNKEVMPRTAFRYALEKMPPDLRKKAMKRSAVSNHRKR